MLTEHESTPSLLDPRSVQTGICILDGQVICGLFYTIRQEDEFGVKKFEPERLAGTLVVWRSKSGETILHPKRNGMYISGRRVHQFEHKHRVEFKFLNLSQVEPHAYKLLSKPYFSLTRQEKWEVCASIARNGVYLASDDDLPAQLFTPTPLLPDPKPSPARIATPQQPNSETQKFFRALLGSLGLVGLVVLPFALLRGLQVGFGGGVAAITAYVALAACIWMNKHKREGGTDVAL